MTGEEALIQLKILNRVGVVNRKGEIIKDTLPYKELYDIIKRDLEILDILKEHAHSSYKETYMYKGPAIPTNKGKYMGLSLDSISIVISEDSENFNKVKDWLNDL